MSIKKFFKETKYAITSAGSVLSLDVHYHPVLYYTLGTGILTVGIAAGLVSGIFIGRATVKK